MYVLMQNLPELLGGLAVIILTVIVDRKIITWPLIGSKKVRKGMDLI